MDDQTEVSWWASALAVKLRSGAYLASYANRAFEIDMFSPLAYPDGAIFYDMSTHVPPPSHLALSPFDLYREPLGIVALADGKELQGATFSKRHSANGTGPTVVEKNIRALYQELEDLRDNYPKALVHHVMIFDYACPEGSDIPMPEGISAVMPEETGVESSIRSSICDVSKLLLSEMTTLARSFEAMTAIESPGHSRYMEDNAWSSDGGMNGFGKRHSQFSDDSGRSTPAGKPLDKSQSRMTMPPIPSRPSLNSSNSTPARPSTPPKGSQSNADGNTSNPPTPERNIPRPGTRDGGIRDKSRDRVSVHGFGPGGANDKWRLKGKGRISVLLGSMYLQAGRWTDSLRELAEGATAARSLNDHLWHGKALELIVMNLFLMGWSNLEFDVPAICLPPKERPRSGSNALKQEPTDMDPTQPKHLRNLQILMPELLERILGLYSRISTENLPTLPLAETTIRFSKILSAIHMCDGKLNENALEMIVHGGSGGRTLTTAPRLSVTPSRQSITNLLFRAFPSSATELLTSVDRISILCGIASVLGPLGQRRKKAMVTRELISVLIGGLVEARTRGAADAGVHPAAGLVSMAVGSGQTNGAAFALDLGEGDIEYGVEAFLRVVCKAYGVVGFNKADEPLSVSKVDDSDAAVLARVQDQASLRRFGFCEVKLNILRACINFSEALPDFGGVLKFSSDLLRTAGSGVVPGLKDNNAAPVITKEEQNRLVANISRTSSLVHRMGLSHLAAEYWDEFLVRGISLEPLPKTRAPIPHAKNVLPGAATDRTSQDVNPFIYNPFLKQPDESAVDKELVAGELASFKITLQNTYEVEVDIESIKLDTEGLEFEALVESTIVGPYRTQALRLKGTPKAEGSIKITGAIVKIAGCRERRFPIFENPWVPPRREKIKGSGLITLQDPAVVTKSIRHVPEIASLSLNVIPAQPLVVIKTISLAQNSVMILDGERQIFTITLQNVSSTPVDFMLFSFKDSTQDGLKAALGSRDTTAAEQHEFEWVLMKRQALRLPRGDQRRYIAPHEQATFDIEILGKAGLTSATIQIDYTHLGVPREEVTEQFYTRRVSLDLTVTVNPSVELARVDALPLSRELPQSFLDRLGASAPRKAEDYCLISMDLRNAWPSQMAIRVEGDDGILIEDNILPGNTSRVIVPVKCIYLEDPYAKVPSLNPANDKQFVVSSTKITPEMERNNREAFWYREKMLDSIRASWRTSTNPKRSGSIELRKMQLTPRMIEAIQVEQVGISISMEESNGNVAASDGGVAYVDELMQLRVRLSNRTSKPILPLIRLMPTLCHRPDTTAMDYTRKLAWNGTLQQLLPEVDGHGSVDFVIGMTALCRGEFEVNATVEEVFVQDDEGEERQDTQKSLDEEAGAMALGPGARRVWHSRRPKTISVRDRG